METKFEILLKTLDECQKQRRHHESYRATMSTILVALYSGMFALQSTTVLTPLAAVVIVMILSALGVVCSISYTERYNFYWRRSQVIRKYLDEEMDGLIHRLYDEAKLYIPDDPNERKWPNKLPKYLRHHYMWTFLHGLVFIFSVVCFIYLQCN